MPRRPPFWRSLKLSPATKRGGFRFLVPSSPSHCSPGTKHCAEEGFVWHHRCCSPSPSRLSLQLPPATSVDPDGRPTFAGGGRRALLILCGSLSTLPAMAWTPGCAQQKTRPTTRLQKSGTSRSWLMRNGAVWLVSRHFSVQPAPSMRCSLPISDKTWLRTLTVRGLLSGQVGRI